MPRRVYLLIRSIMRCYVCSIWRCFIALGDKRWTIRHLHLSLSRALDGGFVTKAPFSIGKPQLRPPRCDTRVTPEEMRSFLARRAQETEQRRALFNAETDAETTEVRFQNYFMNSFHFRRGWKYYASCPLQTILFTILTCAQRTRVHFCPQHWLLCHLGLY